MTAPEQVDAARDWIGIAAGDIHSAALKKNGTLWAWGDNSMFQLGNGPGPAQTNLVQVGSDHHWAAIGCGQGSYTLGMRQDGTLWVWGKVNYFWNGQGEKTFPVPTQICCDTNWVRFTTNVRNWAQNKSGELWYPFNSPPNSNSPASVTCWLFHSNGVAGRFTTAAGGKRNFYELRSNGTLWEATWKSLKPFHFPAAAQLKSFRQKGKRSDWLALWGGSTAIGLTADGTLWFWGTDLSQEPILDAASQLRVFRAQVMKWLRLPPGNLHTVGIQPCQSEPQPLMRLVPAK